MEITSDDRIAINVPLYHTMGCVLGNLMALQYGATMVYPSDGFDPVATLEATTKEKLTVFHGVPTMFTAAIAALDANKAAYDVSSFRAGLIAGSVVPAPLVHRINDDLKMPGLCVLYGMTELSPVATMMGPTAPFEKKVTTVGHVGPMTEIKIIDSHGKIVPRGERGEVCIRGYLVMKEYWDDQKKTEETLDQDGWVHSGDLGQLDEDGYL